MYCGEAATISPLWQPRKQAAKRRSKRRGSATGKQANLDLHRDPTEDELISAIESLYKDQLRPYGRILRKRLVELAEKEGREAPHVDLCRLRAQCSDCPTLQVDTEDDVEWSATMPGLCAHFVDIYDTEDHFSEQFWSDARSYFESSQGDVSFSGGRYACAQGLASLSPSFLQGYSLGRVCHFVQLAMATRMMLGYCNGAIVPYGRSDTMLKNCCAEKQTICTSAKVPPITSWNVFRACLRELFSSVSDGIPLSNIKRLFRSHFQSDLSETVFGFPTLGELMRDVRLKDICSIQLLENGYHVFPSVEESIDSGAIGFARNEGCDEQRCRRSTERGRRRYLALHTADRDVPAHCSSEAFCHGAESPSPNTFPTSPLLVQDSTFMSSKTIFQTFVQRDGGHAETSDAAWQLTCQLLGLPHLDHPDEEEEEKGEDDIEELELWLPFMSDGLVSEESQNESLPSTPVALVPPTPSPVLCAGAFDFSQFSWRPADVSSATCLLRDTLKTQETILSTDAGTSDNSCSVPSTPRMTGELTTAPLTHSAKYFDMLPEVTFHGKTGSEQPAAVDNLADEQVSLAVTTTCNEHQLYIRNTFIEMVEQGSRAHSLSSGRSSSSPPVVARACFGRRKSF
jgi:hypothetical protein